MGLDQARQAGTPGSRSNVISFPSRKDRHESGADVERINQFGFYDVGRRFMGLANFRGPTHPARVFLEIMQARQAASNLVAGKPIPLGVSKGPAETLSSRLRKNG